MTNKSANCYKEVFKYIETKLFKLEPVEIMTDFEAGLRNAIRTVYPKTTIRGCWFHYCSAIHKKCLQLGLHSLLETNPDAKLIRKEIMSLPLLPPPDIENGYKHIKNMAKEYDISSDFRKFFEYFEDYWLKQNKKNSLSVSGLNMKTTSSVESVNSAMGRSFPKHPHLFKFIDFLKYHEFSKVLDLQDLKRGDIPKNQFERKRERDRMRDEKIKHFSAELEAKSIDVSRFLEIMATKEILPPNGNH